MRVLKNLIVPLLMLLLALAITIYVSYINIISTDVVVALLTGILGGISWLIKSESDKKRELERLSYESRRQAYDRLLQPFLNAMISIRSGQQINQDELNASMIEAGTKLFIYGSDEVCKEFNNFRRVSQDPEQNVYKILASYGRLLLAIRKDAGYPDTEMTVEEILRSFIVDYDQHREEIQRYLR